MTTTTPRQAVEALLAEPRLPAGDDERFTGYGLMGMPFAAGHYLALRDMVATSVGPAYRAIWHRDPDARWTIHTTGEPELTCPRYFGAAAETAHASRIDVAWQDDHTLEVRMGDELTWQIELAPTAATRMMTTMGAVLPEAAWNSDAVLGSMGPMARTMLHTGRIQLRGGTPNGQHFKAAPLKIWRVVRATASWQGEDLGAPARLDAQTHLADFWLPQRGIFYVGLARFSPGVDRIRPVASTPGTTMSS
jgi:hypothetical protein